MTRLFNFYHYYYKGLDLIFPPKCASCEREGARWCMSCAVVSRFNSKNVCNICGNPGENNSTCSTCVQSPPFFTSAQALGFHEKYLREAIHQLKYRRNIALGEAMAIELADRMFYLNWDIDLVIPIPLAKKRRKLRGYNQAELLARPFAWKLDFPYSSKILYRSRETRTQIGLNKEERKENVKNAFALKSNDIKEKTIVLIDDVITTGATINSASEVLIAGGAKKVYAFTMSRAHGLTQN